MAKQIRRRREILDSVGSNKREDSDNGHAGLDLSMLCRALGTLGNKEAFVLRPLSDQYIYSARKDRYPSCIAQEAQLSGYLPWKVSQKVSKVEGDTSAGSTI